MLEVFLREHLVVIYTLYKTWKLFLQKSFIWYKYHDYWHFHKLVKIIVCHLNHINTLWLLINLVNESTLHLLFIRVRVKKRSIYTIYLFLDYKKFDNMLEPIITRIIVPVPRWHFCTHLSCMYKKNHTYYMIDHCLKNV